LSYNLGSRRLLARCCGRFMDAFNLGCMWGRRWRPGRSAGCPSTVRSGPSFRLFNRVLDLCSWLVGIEHQTPLWRILRTFSFAAPARGRAAEAYEIDVVSPGLPRSSAGYVHSKPCSSRWRIGIHPLSRPVTPRSVCHRDSTHLASEPPLVSHTAHRGLGDGSRPEVEATLSKSRQDRWLERRELRARYAQTG
jgi:hypothetical protein